MKTHKFKVGVEYEWARMSNGNYKLFGVPIFQETVDERKGQPKRYSAERLKQMADHMNRLQAENFHAPSVHWGHNKPGEGEKEKLGEAVNFRVGKLFGKATIFADIEDIEPEVFEKIKAGKLPHISVEILPTEPPRIGSIAFLSSNAPYFTLPNIRAGKELKTYSVSSSPILFSAGDSLEFVSTFLGEFKMSKEIFMEEELKKEGEKEQMMEDVPSEEGSDLEARVSALEAKIEEILSMLQGGKEPMESSNPIPEEGNEEEGQMAFGKIDMFLAVQEAVSKAVEPLKKDLQKVKNYSRELELEREAEKALRYFDAIGLVVDPEDFRNKLKQKVKKYGIEAGLEYIEELTQYGQKAPVVSKFQYDFAKPDPLHLEKYKEEGQDIFQRALEADQFYTAHAGYLAEQGISRQDYIEGEVAEIRLKKKGVL
ncbi:MAG: hypothetical protein D6785_07815 [Planctomycetota bacterium]|nr:MAG: hypothetical protein D6785_07815 [Planctomycetota bacterium]